MSDDEDNVVRPDFSAGPSLVIDRTARHCRHRPITVCPVQRTATCSRCGAVLDPFAVLMEFASRERRFVWNREQETEFENRIDDLKAEEKRVKARLKRAKGKL